MLDTRFKRLKLISCFIGCEHKVTIVKEYDRKSLFPMLLKFYHHLYPLFEVESSLVHKIDENKGLDIFEIVTDTNEFERNSS
jgi:hypothetical protein